MELISNRFTRVHTFIFVHQLHSFVLVSHGLSPFVCFIRVCLSWFVFHRFIRVCLSWFVFQRFIRVCLRLPSLSFVFVCLSSFAFIIVCLCLHSLSFAFVCLRLCVCLYLSLLSFVSHLLSFVFVSHLLSFAVFH